MTPARTGLRMLFVYYDYVRRKKCVPRNKQKYEHVVCSRKLHYTLPRTYQNNYPSVGYLFESIVLEMTLNKSDENNVSLCCVNVYKVIIFSDSKRSEKSIFLFRLKHNNCNCTKLEFNYNEPLKSSIFYAT